MKILELTRSFYPSIGGMEKFISDRLKIYQSLGYKYQIITTTHSEKQLSNSKKLDDVLYLQSFTPYEIVPGLNAAMNTDFDILSVNQIGYFYSVQAIKLARKRGKEIILTPHFYFHTNRFKLLKTFHYKLFVPKILSKVDKIICFTDYEAEFWSSNFPFIKEKITVIPHYFNQPDRKPKNVKNKYKYFFLFLGRGEKNKRIDLLIHAFNKVQSDYHLVLTIDNDEVPATLKGIVEKDERIHLLGRVSEETKHNLLSTCSALVLPTDYEAFGIVNFEASYYNKPLLLSELSVFKSILNNKGVIYFKNNLESMEKAIRDFMLLDEIKKTEMGKVNYDNLKKFSFKEIIEKYSQLFEELMKN